MKITVPIKGTCPLFGADHEISVDYLYAGTQTNGDVWTKGTFKCRESILANSEVCQNCPVFLNAPVVKR